MNVINTYIKNIGLLVISLFSLNACVATTNTGYSNSSSYNTYKPKPSVNHRFVAEKWYLTKINNRTYQGQRITLEISTKKRVTGFSGCNRYFASVDVLRGDQLKFGTIGSTRKLCTDRNSNQLEKQYLGILRGVTHFNKSSHRLVLEGGYGNLSFYKKSTR
jgi:heat shock protein HslJ